MERSIHRMDVANGCGMSILRRPMLSGRSGMSRRWRNSSEKPKRRHDCIRQCPLETMRLSGYEQQSDDGSKRKQETEVQSASDFFNRMTYCAVDGQAGIRRAGE